VEEKNFGENIQRGGRQRPEQISFPHMVRKGAAKLEKAFQAKNTGSSKEIRGELHSSSLKEKEEKKKVAWSLGRGEGGEGKDQPESRLTKNTELGRA